MKSHAYSATSITQGGLTAHWAAWRLVVLLAAVACLLYGTFAGGPPEADQPLKVAIGVWPGSDTLVYARETSHLSHRDVHLIEMSWSSATKVAFVNRVVDAAVISLDEVLRLQESGDDFKVVLVLGFSNGGDAVLVRPPFRNLTELRGRKIGVETYSVGSYVFAAALQKAEMTQKDLEVVPLNLAEMQNAFDTGEVDAVVTGEPWTTRLLSHGVTNIYDSTQLPREVCRVLVVRPEVLVKRPERVKKLVRAHLDSRKLLRESQDPPVIDTITRRLGITRAELIGSLDKIRMPGLEENRKLLGGENPELAKITATIGGKMVQRGLLNAMPERSNWLTDAFLPEAP